MIPIRNLKRFFIKTLKQPGYAFKVFIKRIKAYFSYWLRGGKSSYPEAITLFLTHRCNLHCKMCGQWGEAGVTKKESGEYIKEELSLKELKKLINDAAKFKPNITLFGGEPLLHSNCIEIIKYIKEKNMHCLIITNGSLISDMAQKIIDSGLDELNVSIDGDRKLHEEIRGIPGIFDKIMEGLKKINDIKKSKNIKKPLINLQCTMSKYNYKHLKEMLNVADEAKANSITFHNLIFLEKPAMDKQKEYDKVLGCSSRAWEGFVFKPEINPEELYRIIEEIRNVPHKFTVDFYPNFSLEDLKKYYKSSFFSECHCRCVSPWMAAYIFPDGEVRPCLNFDYSFGSIKENKFIEIWNNEKARRYRKILKKNKIFPACVRCTELYRY